MAKALWSADAAASWQEAHQAAGNTLQQHASDKLQELNRSADNLLHRLNSFPVGETTCCLGCTLISMQHTHTLTHPQLLLLRLQPAASGSAMAASHTLKTVFAVLSLLQVVRVRAACRHTQPGAAAAHHTDRAGAAGGCEATARLPAYLPACLTVCLID
jgi:hypothetical protein